MVKGGNLTKSDTKIKEKYCERKFFDGGHVDFESMNKEELEKFVKEAKKKEKEIDDEICFVQEKQSTLNRNFDENDDVLKMEHFLLFSNLGENTALLRLS